MFVLRAVEASRPLIDARGHRLDVSLAAEAAVDLRTPKRAAYCDVTRVNARLSLGTSYGAEEQRVRTSRSYS